MVLFCSWFSNQFWIIYLIKIVFWILGFSYFLVSGYGFISIKSTGSSSVRNLFREIIKEKTEEMLLLLLLLLLCFIQNQLFGLEGPASFGI